MSNISPFPFRDDRRVEQAAEWIARLGRGLTPAEEEELGAWLAHSQGNHDELMEQARLWDGMDGMSRLAELFPEPRGAGAARRGIKTATWQVAAALMLAVGVIAWLGYHDSADVPQTVEMTTLSPMEFATGIGGRARHVLPDGSVIVLNTDTEIRVNYTSSNRLLELVRGEVHVSVAHDMNRPLSVMVGDKVVQAVGTEFNLEITSEHTIELLVADGLVMVGVVEQPIETLDKDVPLLLTPESRLVAAGQEASISLDKPELEQVEPQPIDNKEISVKLSWRDGNLIFRGESLEEAVSEIGRYTAVEFVFLDEQAKQVRVAGLFKAGDVDGLLSALRNHFNISYEWQGDHKILLSTE